MLLFFNFLKIDIALISRSNEFEAKDLVAVAERMWKRGSTLENEEEQDDKKICSSWLNKLPIQEVGEGVKPKILMTHSYFEVSSD